MARARSNSGRVDRYPRGRRRGRLFDAVVSAGGPTRSRGEALRGESGGGEGEDDGVALKGSNCRLYDGGGT